MNIATVAVYSDADRRAVHVAMADEAVHVGPSPAGESYLVAEKILEACRATGFKAHHPEDVAICRTNRALLGQQQMRFAPVDVADAFAAERAGDPTSSFGYHGVFLMPLVLGTERFWRMYFALDERGSLRPDYGDLLKSLRNGRFALWRSARMQWDRCADRITRLRRGLCGKL